MKQPTFIFMDDLLTPMELIEQELNRQDRESIDRALIELLISLTPEIKK